MDGDPVTGEPSQHDDKDGGGTADAPKTYTEVFMKVFPKYLTMGMTYEQFWHGPAWLVRAYRESYNDRIRDEEWARWRQGAYFYDALLRVAPVMRAAFGKGKVEPGKYPQRPWPLTEKEAQEQEAEDRQKRFERFIAVLNKESEETLKKQREETDEAIEVVGEDGRDRESVHTDQRERDAGY